MTPFWWGFAAGFATCAVLIGAVVVYLGRMFDSG